VVVYYRMNKLLSEEMMIVLKRPFVLNQHTKIGLYIDWLLTQQYVDRHVASTGHIVLTLVLCFTH